MIRTNCPKCDKPIEVPTLCPDGPFDMHSQHLIPYYVKLSLDGTMSICGCCKTASRFEYDYVEDKLSLIV